MGARYAGAFASGRALRLTHHSSIQAAPLREGAATAFRSAPDSSGSDFDSVNFSHGADGADDFGSSASSSSRSVRASWSRNSFETEMCWPG